MNSATKFDQGSRGQVFVRGMVEDRASRSQGKHEGESSSSLCDRLSRTRDLSQRQLPTDHDYAVPTREYQTDQSSLKSAPAAAGSVLEKQKQRQKPHGVAGIDRVTPYQGWPVCPSAFLSSSVLVYAWTASLDGKDKSDPVKLSTSCRLVLPDCGGNLTLPQVPALRRNRRPILCKRPKLPSGIVTASVADSCRSNEVSTCFQVDTSSTGV